MIRTQYHFRKSESGLLAWDVRRLIEKSAALAVYEVELDSIHEMDEQYWYSIGGALPTCRNIAEHAALIDDADLNYPILLDVDGRVMDGMHRICKALNMKLPHIKAKRFQEAIPPEYIGVEPSDLP